MLTGSELTANGGPSSGVNGTMSPMCRSGRYDNRNVLKEVAHSSFGKSSAKYRCAENRGRRLFSSPKPPQIDEQRERAVRSSLGTFSECYVVCRTNNHSVTLLFFLPNQLQGTQSVSSARSFQKGIPRVPTRSTDPYKALGRIWSALFNFIF